jgi:hypothetical protein
MTIAPGMLDYAAATVFDITMTLQFDKSIPV